MTHSDFQSAFSNHTPSFTAARGPRFMEETTGMVWKLSDSFKKSGIFKQKTNDSLVMSLENQKFVHLRWAMFNQMGGKVCISG